MTYLPVIDGMRAIAVLAVVIFHLDRNWLPGGFVGVDIFFVISGFLITGIILRDLEREKFTLSEFFQRRIARIFPAFIVVGIATLAAAAVIYTNQDFASAGISLAAAVVSLANLKFMLQGNYFEVSPDAQPLLHCWSLSLEEQFYLLYPLLLLATFKHAPTRILTITVGMAAVSLLFCVALTPTEPGWAFYLLPTRAWELLAGSILALASLRTHAESALPKNKWVSITGILLVSASFLLLDENISFPGWSATVPVLGSVLILSQARSDDSIISKILASRTLTTVGKASFSLYLWHWPVFAMVDYRMCFASPLERFFAKVALTAVLVLLTYQFVEQPARKFLSERRHQTAAYMLLAAALILVVPLGVFVRRTQFVGAEMKDIPKGGLVFDSGANAKSVVLMGDSHATMYGKLMKEICEELGYKLTVLAVSAKDPLPNATPSDSALWTGSLAVVRKEKPDLLVLVCHWSSKLRKDRSRLQTAIADLAPHAGRVIILNQPPSLPPNASRAGLRSGERPPFVEEKSHSRERLAVNAHLASQASPVVQILPVAGLFELPGGEVRFIDPDNQILYQDANHLSGYGAEQVRSMLREHFLQK